MFSRKLQAFFYVSHSETVWLHCGNRTVHGRELYVFRNGNVKNCSSDIGLRVGAVIT